MNKSKNLLRKCKCNSLVVCLSKNFLVFLFPAELLLVWLHKEVAAIFKLV